MIIPHPPPQKKKNNNNNSKIKKKSYFLLWRLNFVLANSVDPGEMPPCAAFHLGLHSLPRYPFRGSRSTKG